MRLAGLSVRTAFWCAAGLTAIFRLWLAGALPITGDEAYFYWWGVYPDLGYYDHPPMIGWWLSALLPISHDIAWLRLPSLLLPYAAAALAWRLAMLASHERDRAWWAALIVLLAPTHVWNVLVTTDTPMIFFALLSATAYAACVGRLAEGSWGRRADSGAGCMVIAGLMLSLALLAKYFAVFLAFAFLAHIVFVRRDAKRGRDLALLVVFALPGPILNLWWNSAHCWDNILFNVFNRNAQDMGAGWTNPLYYVATLAYLLGPYALWTAWRQRSSLARLARRGGTGGTVIFLAAVPLALFALLALARTVGLHWPLAFAPLALVALVVAVPENRLSRLFWWSVGLALLHVALFVVLLGMPFTIAKNTKYYDSMVLALRVPAVIAPLQALEKRGEEFTLASDGYSNAVTLGYHLKRYVAVFGTGSLHARQDDLLTDWRALDGKNIATYRKTDFSLGEYTPYFARVEVEEHRVEGVKFSLIKGYGFKYAAYRDGVLREIRDRWYRLPDWLPNRGCYFCERYFPDEPCAARHDGAAASAASTAAVADSRAALASCRIS
jgi:hypothetical protein